jgi:tRNA(Ile)-lysidine synthase
LTESRPTPLEAAVRRTLAAWGEPRPGQTVVAALSGGADSVALTDALIAAGRDQGFAVVVAHLDHGLRPESVEDARFCEELGARYGVSVRIGRADVRARAARDHGGLEEAARRSRYAFLETVRQETGAMAIAVGHTRDDQAETFLLRLLRGAGTDGLASMRPRSGGILRPLLAVSRAEVLAHLAARGLSWREDASNRDLSLLRNRVRHELLPYLEARFNPEVRPALARSAELLAEDAAALDTHVAARFRAALRQDGESWVLPLALLSEAPVGEARRALRLVIERAGGLRGVSAHHVEAVRALAAQEDASGHGLPLPGRRHALVSFGELRIGPEVPPASPYAFPLPVPGRILLPDGLAVQALPDSGPPRSTEDFAVIPAFSGLVVRTRRAGDRVVDGGREMSLKRFLMRRRVPTTCRPGLPLVASGDRVLWIPGHAPAAGDVPASQGCVRLSLDSARTA